MKIVCLCQRGNIRSVSLAFLLKDEFGQDAVAIGWQTAGEELSCLLFCWAERIIVMEDYMRAKVPERFSGKVLVCDVGPDHYGNSKHPDLLRKVRDWLGSHIRQLRI